MMFQVYQWLPIPYDNSSVPANIRDLWQKYHITLKCEGAVSSLLLEITTSKFESNCPQRPNRNIF